MFHVEHALPFTPMFGVDWISMFHVEHRLLRLKSGGGISPFCSTQREKSHVEALRRGGVPVLRRINSNPRFAREVESLFAAGLPSPPDSTI
jgi:hypothetical protein